jgi:hypothetical protein
LVVVVAERMTETLAEHLVQVVVPEAEMILALQALLVRVMQEGVVSTQVAVVAVALAE